MEGNFGLLLIESARQLPTRRIRHKGAPTRDDLAEIRTLSDPFVDGEKR
jgi:hypothetical protein